MKLWVKLVFFLGCTGAYAQPIRICFKDSTKVWGCKFSNDVPRAIDYVQFALDSLRGNRFYTASLDSSQPFQWFLLPGPSIPTIDTGENLSTYRDRGYWNASANYQIWAWKNDTLLRWVNIDSGSLSVMGSIDVGAAAQWVNPSWLQRQMRLKPGKPVSTTVWKKAAQQLQSLSFIEQTSPPQWITENDSLRLRLFLAQRKVNVFDGMLALANNLLPDGRNVVQITGEFQAHGANWLKRGGELDFGFRGLQQATQMQLEWRKSGLFYAPIGLGFQGNTYRRDTSQLMSDLQGGVEFLFSPQQYLRFTVGQRSWTTPDTLTRYFPIGLKWSWDFWNPFRSQGGEMQAQVWTAGPRSQWNVKVHRIWSWNTYWKTGIQFRSMGLRGLPLEELRVGGMDTWKGLDEGQLTVKSWGWLQLEQRWYFESTSFASLQVQAGKADAISIFSGALGTQLQIPQGWLGLYWGAAFREGGWQNRLHISLKMRPF